MRHIISSHAACYVDILQHAAAALRSCPLTLFNLPKMRRQPAVIKGLGYLALFFGSTDENYVYSRLNNSNEESDCSIFLGPSIIKEKEQQGFGLGMFAGKDIAAGTVLSNLSEVLIPIYDSSTLDSDLDPTFREYLWGGAEIPELALVGSETRNALWFSPGLSSIAPCTINNYNLQLSGAGVFTGVSRQNVADDADSPTRDSHHAGAYSYRHSLSYLATRDIRAGEELVVECPDDDFDGSAHQTSAFDPTDSRFICVDDIGTAGPASDSSIGGMGLRASRQISSGDVITSSPVIPIHRKELFGDGTGSTVQGQPYQLLLNYVLGHEDSDLLLLPYGPLTGYINHPPTGKKANAIIRWHSLDQDAHADLPRRQQFHHSELLGLAADEVVYTHGKGLMIDYVALDDIADGEEIYLDYGDAWRKAWDNHVRRWPPSEDAKSYKSADRFCRETDCSQKDVRTIEEQKTNPYPDNLETVCFYDNDATIVKFDQQRQIVYTTWTTEDDWPHECMRPCRILQRYASDVDDDERSEGEWFYTAEMLPFDGPQEICNLTGGRHIATDVPWDAILIVDRPLTTDTFLDQAFRHEVGVPSDLYPTAWLRKRVRRRSASDETSKSAKKKHYNEFKRRKKDDETKKTRLMKERSPRFEL